MNMKRFYVEPCDNCGTVEPKPPRDRTWLVMDRNGQGGYAASPTQVAEFNKRADARAEAARRNSEATGR